MSLNDTGDDEFDNQIEDEDGSIYPTAGVEIGALRLQPDYGSGSFAEDGRLEVAEDMVMNNGEAQVGSAAMYGPTEIGAGWAPGDGQSEIGQYAQDGASEIGHGPFSSHGATEIGHGPFSSHGAAEIGYNPYAVDGAAEIGRVYGPFSQSGASEIGSAAMYGPTEIGTGWSPREGEGGNVGQSWMPHEGHGGNVGQGWMPHEGHGGMVGHDVDIQAPFESFMLGPTRTGDWSPEQGYVGGEDDIGALAVAKVIEKARDNRQPPPPLRAVDVDEVPLWPDNWTDGLSDVIIGAAEATGHPDPFPLTSQFMLRCGAGMPMRIVRVDTEESYKQFRQESSPEVQALHQKLAEHIADEDAHGGGYDVDEDPELNPNHVDPDDIVILGEAVKAAEKEKEVELYMPQHFDGHVTAWREGDYVCSSMRIPGFNGEVRVCTTLEPIEKCVSEMSHHAVEAGVPASTVVGALSAMGCVLGAGTGLKEMAAAAPSIAVRPEMKSSAPFMVRIEPKASPALCALAMLVLAVKENVPGASAEWDNLASLSSAPVKQAMQEAVVLAKAAGR